MRQSRFTEAQIIGMIKEQEAGMPPPLTKVYTVGVGSAKRYQGTSCVVWLHACLLEGVSLI